MPNYRSLYHRQYLAINEELTKMRNILREIDDEFLRAKNEDGKRDFLVLRKGLKLIDKKSNLKFEQVMDIFKDYIEEDTDIEVVKFRYGYQIFELHYMGDGVYEYLSESELLNTPDELFEALLKMGEMFYKILFEKPVEENIFKISKENQKIIDTKVAAWKAKYEGITGHSIDNLQN